MFHIRYLKITHPKFYLIMKCTLWYRFPAGVAPVLIGMLFLGSVQLLFMGVLGEYIGAILRKVSRTTPILSELYPSRDAAYPR